VAKKRGLGTDAFYEQPSGPAQQPDSTTSQQRDSVASRQRDSVTSQQPDGKIEKTKVTLYFEDDTIAQLDAAQLRLRNLAADTVGKDKRKLVTKSIVVEWALKAALKELEEAGPASLLAKEIARL
jgi:hypothetical protein